MSVARSVQYFIGCAAMMCLMVVPAGAGDAEADLGTTSINPLKAGARAGTPELADPWVTVPPCPEGVSRPAGAVVSGKFYVIGGESTGGARFGYVQTYDPATGMWDNTNATMPTPASNICAAVYGTDIYIPGGYDGTYLTDLQVYHTTTDTWETIATDPLPYGPSGGACASYGGKIYVFGGNDAGIYQDAAYVYDPVAAPGGRWSPIASLPVAGGYGAAVPALNGIFYGGFIDSGSADRAEIYWYDPMLNSWTTYPSLNTPRAGARLWTYEGKLAVGGGGWGTYLSSVEEYDLSTGLGGVWSPGNPLNVGRRTFAAAQDNLNSVLYAGAGWAGGFLTDVEGADFTPEPLANVLVSRGYPYSGSFQNIYGGNLWPQMTAAINGSANSVTVTPNLSDISYLMEFDALWVDQRGTDSDPNPVLTAPEIANIASFIASGKRVVMLGENAAWSNWNNQILGICGGSFAGGTSGLATAILAHELTEGVAQVDIISAGTADSGLALFDRNFATLWPGCGQVLTILDVNSQNTNEWPNLDHAAFYTNVAEWIGSVDGMPFSDGFESGDTSRWSATHP